MQKETFKKWALPVIVVGLVILALVSFMRRTHGYQVHILLPNGKTILADVADSPEEHLLGLFAAGSLPSGWRTLMGRAALWLGRIDLIISGYFPFNRLGFNSTVIAVKR